MPAQTPLSVVVVTHDSETLLPACLASVRPQVEDLGGELIVVDNASTDRSATIAAAAGAHVVRSRRNLGFAAGCAHGAAAAAGRLLVFVNPDAVLDPGCLAGLADAAAASPRDGPLGARARHDDGSLDPRCVLGAPSLWGAVTFATGLSTAGRGTRLLDPAHGPRQLPRAGPPIAVAACSGAVMAVPRRLWESLGGFDQRFFLYGEDVDLCVRAARAGWRPVHVPAAGYRHAGGIARDGSLHRRILLHRGKVELYRRHLTPRSARAAVTALQLGALLRGVPAHLSSASLSRRAEPWWQLYQARDQWRHGYPLPRSEAPA